MGVERCVLQVQPPLEPLQPRLRPWLLRLLHGALPLLLRLRLFPWLPAGIARVDVLGADTLARCWQRFENGEVRLILAFRHCEVDDPLCGLQLLSRHLPRAARRLGQPLRGLAHAHFFFDRGMTRWAGPLLGWSLAGIGGIAVRRGRQPDWLALRQARALVLDGRLPFAVAPEGATNGHGERIGPLEPGVARLALWCLDDLRREGRSEEVQILPVAIQYHYLRPSWPRLERLLARMEVDVGIPPPPLQPAGCSPAVRLYPRLLRLGEALLDALDGFYGRYPRLPGDGAVPAVVEPGVAAPASSLGLQVQQLVQRSLAVAETLTGVAPAGDVVDRCRRLEEGAWRWQHPDDLPPRHRLSPLQRGLADWAAHEAALAELHMRLAETFVAVSGSYVAERPSFERFMETTLLIHDALSRLRGDRLPARPRLGARSARITVAEPLRLGEAGSAGPSGRAAVRARIAAVSEALRSAYEQALI